MPAEQQRTSSRIWSRRELGWVIGGAAAITTLGGVPSVRAAQKADSLLRRFCLSLSAEQRREIVFPGHDPKRRVVQNHWAVVRPTIADLTAEQQELALGLIRQVCTADGFARLTRQRDEDAGGWKQDHLAVFGTPNDLESCEWVLSGRHLTLRGSATGAISGGPLFLGDTAPEATNIATRTTELAETLFRTLNEDQRRLARQPKTWGLNLAELGSPGQLIAHQLLASLGEPFHCFDVAAVQNCLQDHSALGRVCWQTYRSEHDQPDDPPKVWRLIGPGFVWSFHGTPHVHSRFEPLGTEANANGPRPKQ